MLLQLLFRNLATGQQTPTQLGVLTLDVTLEEEHTLRARATDHPVEGGGTIQDHVVLEPRALNISGFISDSPLVARGLPLGTIRSASAFSILEQLWLNRTPFMVVSQLRVYQNMVVERISVPKNSREAALRFQCSLKEIIFVASQNTTIPASSGSAPQGRQAATGGGTSALNPGNISRPQVDSVAVDTGRAAPETVTPPVPEVVPPNKSWATSLGDLF